MIRNLNQVTFQGFGTVPPERSHSTGGFDKSAATPLPLSQENAVIFRALSDTWAAGGTGSSVLSVSLDGESYQDYYLDKPVCIKPGVLFIITPFVGQADALLWASTPPEKMGTRNFTEPQIDRQLQVDDVYTFFYQEKEQGFLFPGESHPMAELTYVDQGSLHSVAEGQDLLLKQGDLVIYGPGQWHMQYADRPVSFLTVSFRAAELPCSRLTGRALSLTARQIGLVRQMLEAHGAESYAYDCVESLLKLLLADLLRGLDRQPSADAAQPLPATSHTERRIVDRLVQLISARAGEKLSLQALADEAHISTTYLHRLFRSQLGISPGAYIAKIRIEESKLLLRGGALSMGEIAKKLGFSSQQHFSRQFRTVTGMTPSEYVRSLR